LVDDFILFFHYVVLDILFSLNQSGAALQLGLHQSKPKRMRFVVDVSASMARFNAWDQRLDRMAEMVVCVCVCLAWGGACVQYSRLPVLHTSARA
jgi:hypothetical protein